MAGFNWHLPQIATGTCWVSIWPVKVYYLDPDSASIMFRGSLWPFKMKCFSDSKIYYYVMTFARLFCFGNLCTVFWKESSYVFLKIYSINFITLWVIFKMYLAGHVWVDNSNWFQSISFILVILAGTNRVSLWFRHGIKFLK